MKRQLSFALSLGSLVSAAAARADAEVKAAASLLNPQATCANYEKLEQACQQQGERLRKLGKIKHHMVDADLEPALAAAYDALKVFDGCTEYYVFQLKADHSITKDVEALVAAEEKCKDLVIRNYGMHIEGLQEKVTAPRDKMRTEYYGLLSSARNMLDVRAVSQLDKDKIEAKEANQAADKIDEKIKGTEQTMLEEDPRLRKKVNDIAKKGHGNFLKKVPGFNSVGDALKTALGIGTLGAGLGMGIRDLMNLANNNLSPLTNPVGVAAGASSADTSTEAASGGGVGSTNPSVADSSLVRLTAQVTEYADGRRVVNGETTGKLSSSGSGVSDEARGDNSGRSGADTSSSSTLSSQSPTGQPALASGEGRAAVRTLSSDSRREKYVDEQESDDSEAQRHRHSK